MLRLSAAESSLTVNSGKFARSGGSAGGGEESGLPVIAAMIQERAAAGKAGGVGLSRRTGLARSARVLARGEVLAPAGLDDRALHDLAVIRRIELQTDLATLLPLGMVLVERLLLRDLVRLLDLLVGRRAAGDAARGDHAQSHRAAPQQAAARQALDHKRSPGKRARRRRPAHRAAARAASTYFATSSSCALETCQSTMW